MFSYQESGTCDFSARAITVVGAGAMRWIWILPWVTTGVFGELLNYAVTGSKNGELDAVYSRIFKGQVMSWAHSVKNEEIRDELWFIYHSLDHKEVQISNGDGAFSMQVPNVKNGDQGLGKWMIASVTFNRTVG